jgi:two-component system phosphate regulon response regulator PhoB
MSSLVLVVDDEVDLVTTIEYNLKREGYLSRRALTGMEALTQARTAPIPDIVILDLMLPDISGIEVFRRLRDDPHTRNISVIMATARGDEIDRIIGLELGAEDYLAKPFSIRELILRVGTIVRRNKGVPREEARSMAFADLRIDLEGHRVHIGNREIVLTAIEFKLLCLLVKNKGRVQTRDQLLRDVWEIQSSVNTRTVDTHIKRLRQKLEDAGKYIETLRGVGYRLTAR